MANNTLSFPVILYNVWSAAGRNVTYREALLGLFRRSPASGRHNVAGKDLSRSTYSGMFGFLIVEPASDPGRYDQEVLLAAHHWEGSWVSMQDIRKGPPPDNGNTGGEATLDV